MSLSKEKLTIMIRKNDIRIRPSIKLNPIDGRTGCRYPRTVFQVRVYHGSGARASCRRSAGVPACGGGAVLVDVTAAGVAQPAAIKSAFVNNSGAAMKSSTLKIRAKTIELAAAAVPPFFNSSFERFF